MTIQEKLTVALRTGDHNTAKKIVGAVVRETGFKASRLGVWKMPKALAESMLTAGSDEAIVTRLNTWFASHGLGEPVTVSLVDRAIARALGTRKATPEAKPDPAPAPAPAPAVPEGASLDAIIARIAADAAARTLESAKDRLLDAEQVARIAREAVADVEPIRVQLPGTSEVKDLGRQHRLFKHLLAWVQVGRPILLYGPAGSGKTTAARKAAEALGLTPLVLHLGPQTTQASIFGYMSANGEYVETPFRRAYEGRGEFSDGAVIILDEFDRCNPRVAVTLNGLIENGHGTFPDAECTRHPRTIFVACANTPLGGADRDYVSAQQQDAAVRDRFAVLLWDYDEDFERELALAAARGAGADAAAEKTVNAWVDKVQRYRRAARKAEVRLVISPRASITGAMALAKGIDEAEVEAAVVWKGLAAEEVERVKGRV